MLTKSDRIGIFLLGLGILITPAWAVDYSRMSTEELARMRGTNQNLSSEERAEFQKEWQIRMRKMSQAERQKYTGKPENSPPEGSDTGQGKGKLKSNKDNMGRDYGKIKKIGSEEGDGRNNQGNDRGNNENRERNRYKKSYRNQNIYRNHNRRFDSGGRSMGGSKSGRGRR